MALPGARFEVDKAANRYKISKIFGGQNEEHIYRSPLTEVGSDAKVGDYVIAINGENVTADRDIYSYPRQGRLGGFHHAQHVADGTGSPDDNVPTRHKRKRPDLSRLDRSQPPSRRSDVERASWLHPYS